MYTYRELLFESSQQARPVGPACPAASGNQFNVMFELGKDSIHNYPGHLSRSNNFDTNQHIICWYMVTIFVCGFAKTVAATLFSAVPPFKVVGV